MTYPVCYIERELCLHSAELAHCFRLTGTDQYPEIMLICMTRHMRGLCSYVTQIQHLKKDDISTCLHITGSHAFHCEYYIFIFFVTNKSIHKICVYLKYSIYLNAFVIFKCIIIYYFPFKAYDNQDVLKHLIFCTGSYRMWGEL